MMASKICRLSLTVLLMALFLSASGCARYARNVSHLYDPVTMSKGGSGTLYIVTPADKQTKADDVKWVIGIVKDDDGKKIDEVMSSKSAEELIQDALTQELRRSGYTVVATASRQPDQVKTVELTKVDLALEQISDIADLKASCRISVSLDVYKKGQLVKKLQYESKNSDRSIKDRNLLAGKVLQDALQSAMQKAVPDLITILEP